MLLQRKEHHPWYENDNHWVTEVHEYETTKEAKLQIESFIANGWLPWIVDQSDKCFVIYKQVDNVDSTDN